MYLGTTGGFIRPDCARRARVSGNMVGQKEGTGTGKMAEAILNFTRVPEILGLPISSKPNPINQPIKTSFLSPHYVVDVVEALRFAEVEVREHWDELPAERHEELWQSVQRLIEPLSEAAPKPRMSWRKASIMLSVVWASLREGRDLPMEFKTAFNGFVDAVLEKVASEPYNELPADAQLTIQLKTGESKRVFWKDVDTFLEAEGDRIDYQFDSDQPPRRTKKAS